MERSWLVQRLKKPLGAHPVFGPGNPFAFGGGLPNGGLSADAMGLLRGIFSFDYMGAAEFEFGTVPEALSDLAHDVDKLTAFSFTIPLREVPPNWHLRKADVPLPDGEATIYVIARADQNGEVTDRIRTWATTDREDLKEMTHLASTLRPYNEWDTDVCGWLELDNGFFFFTDAGMWRATAALFGLELPAEAVSA